MAQIVKTAVPIAIRIAALISEVDVAGFITR
jgi:hypothetical protein